MKAFAVVLGLVSFAPMAQAQVFPQAPAYPGLGVGAPPRYAPARPDGDEGYWRNRQGEEWRRREEYREEARREEWVRAHCVRDYRGQEFCRR